VHTPKRSNRPTVQPKTQASIDDQHSEAILGKLGEKNRLTLFISMIYIFARFWISTANLFFF
jgi:hypothetical protein